MTNFYDYKSVAPTFDDDLKTIFTIEGDFEDWFDNWFVPFVEFNGFQMDYYFDDVDYEWSLENDLAQVSEEELPRAYKGLQFEYLLEWLTQKSIQKDERCKRWGLIVVRDKIIWINWETLRGKPYSEIYDEAW
jgi:hypothetical protein